MSKDLKHLILDLVKGGYEICIGKDVRLRVHKVKRRGIRLSIFAPEDVIITRAKPTTERDVDGNK